MSKLTHEKLVKDAFKRPGVKLAYDELKEEFVLLREMIKAREQSGKTQEDIATAMKTSTSMVGRLETGGGKLRHSPTIATLNKYAAAIGHQLSIKLVPIKKSMKK